MREGSKYLCVRGEYDRESVSEVILRDGGDTPVSMTRLCIVKVTLLLSGQAVLVKIAERNSRWSLESLQQRRQDRIEYIRLYIKKLSKKLGDEKEKLARMEKILRYEDIVLYVMLIMPKLK